MTDEILHWAETLMSSPWIYAAIVAIAAIDAFFPAVPSETMVITAGVFAASIGEPNLVLVAAFAALGAFVGDHISYAIGRYGGTRVRSRLGSTVDKAFTWADKALHRRGASILLVARYIPGGRTATTVTCGTVQFPLRTFSLFDAMAAITWGVYSAGIGFIGGEAFEENPLAGLAVGLGIAIGIAAIIELVRARRYRSRPDDADSPSADSQAADSLATESAVTESREAVAGADDDAATRAP